MFRSLRTTIEYTDSALKYVDSQRVKENHGEGWHPKIVDKNNSLVIIEGKRHHKIALELGKSWCYIEFINPLIFPAYIKLNGRPLMLKQGQSIVHKQMARKLVVSRMSNTTEQNYYIQIRSD